MRKTLADRSNIINLIDEGKKATEVSDEFFVDRSQISRWCNQKEEIDKLVTCNRIHIRFMGKIHSINYQQLFFQMWFYY